MSGGAREYIGRRWAEGEMSISNAYILAEVFGLIEHELDWGECGDTCLDCARLRVSEACRLTCEMLCPHSDEGPTMAGISDVLTQRFGAWMCPPCFAREQARAERVR
jgi:hypothetical protein